MRGLVLEGGGAKGSFHVGALKALYERGYTFDGVTGTSIGALNGAFIAQNDFDTLYEIWYNETPSMLFEVDESMFCRILNKDYDKDVFKYAFRLFKSTLSTNGVPLDKAQALLAKYIDEDRIRKSNIDFGIVTVLTSDDWKPLELFKEDIPEGELKDYLLTSAYLPIFNRPLVGGKQYLDGGLYDNCPVNPLIYRGYDNIIAIRTGSNMPRQQVIDGTVKVDYIEPSDTLGKLLDFRTERIRENIRLGYFDALRYTDRLLGVKYYVKPLSRTEGINFIENLGHKVYVEWAKILGVTGTRQELLSRAIEAVTYELGLNWNLEKVDVIIAILESVALDLNLEKFKIYSLDEFIKAIIENWRADYKPKHELSYSLVKILIENYVN